MGVKLEYTRAIGKSKETTFTSDVVQLIDKGIIGIDLVPLSSSPSLQTLDLTLNQLQHIDLTPLSLCANLKELWLQANQLQSVDLAPLSSCTNLQSLSLGTNQFKNIISSAFTRLRTPYKLSDESCHV